MSIPLLDGTIQLGEQLFDEQNKELIINFNNLSKACQEGECSDVVFALLKYLNKYVSEHLPYEEALMELFNYPEQHDHREQHTRFKKDIENYTEMLAHYEPLEELVIKIYRTFFQWIINHVRKLDKDMIEYIKPHFAAKT